MFDYEATTPAVPERSVPERWAGQLEEVTRRRVRVDVPSPGPHGTLDVGAPCSTPVLDDHLLAELSGRVSQVLLSAKAASDEIISQAMERADLFEQLRHEQLHERSEQAEREARELLARARQKGQALFDEAHRSGERMLAEARAERDDMLADLVDRRAMLEEEVGSRQAELVELREASTAIGDMVGEVLSRFGDGYARTSSKREIPAVPRRRRLTSISAARGLRKPS